jgi:predicted nuclease of predicted toxin-antitoxin system
VRFLIDENLPPALARWLIEWGHEATHVHEVGLAQTVDLSIAELAFSRGEVIVSKDRDFMDLALLGRTSARLLWVRCGNLGLPAFRIWFEARLPETLDQLLAGVDLVELR